MSKSLGPKHYINVFEDEKRLRKQIGSAVTDAGDMPLGQMSEGVENLFELIKACGKTEIYDSLLIDFNKGGMKYVDLKQATADALVELSEQFRANKAELNAKKKEVKNQIKYSSMQIRKTAQETLREVKELTGLLNVKM
ncbi:MAG: tryptophanyl-tRNA synthetase [Saprospiraceae bacterium]|jgi:tryptophanyl-tRNA synthetase